MKIRNLEINLSSFAVGIVRTLNDGITETTFVQFRGLRLFVRRWFEKGGVEWI